MTANTTAPRYAHDHDDLESCLPTCPAHPLARRWIGELDDMIEEAEREGLRAAHAGRTELALALADHALEIRKALRKFLSRDAKRVTAYRRDGRAVEVSIPVDETADPCAGSDAEALEYLDPAVADGRGDKPAVALRAGAVYFGDNGRAMCLDCAGGTALYTGHDLSGQRLKRVTALMVAEWKRADPDLALECTCRKVSLYRPSAAAQSDANPNARRDAAAANALLETLRAAQGGELPSERAMRVSSFDGLRAAEARAHERRTRYVVQSLAPLTHRKYLGRNGPTTLADATRFPSKVRAGRAAAARGWTKNAYKVVDLLGGGR